MPKLTEEQIAKLYPQAKTYDEIQAERELQALNRQPKFVAEKIGLWATLSLPVVYTLYRLLSHIVADLSKLSGGGMPPIGQVLFAVSFSLLLLAISYATLYYLYSLIDSVASKVIIATRLLYAALAGILCTVVAAFMFSLQLGYSTLLALILLPLFNFLAAYGAAKFMLKRQLVQEK